MNDSKDEDDFSEIGAKVDCLVIQESYDQLEEYLSQVRSKFDSNQDPKNATVFYFMGTGYCDLACYHRRSDVDTSDDFCFLQALFGEKFKVYPLSRTF